MLAPLKYVTRNGERVLAENPDPLLDVADLVIIDTPGSGFTRELRPGRLLAPVHGDVRRRGHGDADPSLDRRTRATGIARIHRRRST
ncbi:MAG: hypothetical protein IT481_14410 [Gammaproteobacteria bacterium]|nr:hypothetical protein [Gammaproteobacteria bacterium]